ncbi:recombination endonuclease [Synechococcus phage S-CREM1]|nr:recombination endonuclease [Synechococcus phage S-CREM1]
MIIFNTIRWKNFLSTGNNFTELKLDESSSTLIQGTNGAGKSTLLDAICFALFNKPFRKINKPQLINSINEKECVVEVEFTISKTNWKIVRGIKPNKFEIYRDGKLLDQEAATTDQQKWLEQTVLKLNFKSFTQVVILGSSTFVPFMQLTPANRREVIEDILDIQIFSTMNILLKDRLRQVQEQQRECGYELKSAEDKVRMQKEYIENSQSSNETEIQHKKSQLVSISEEIAELQKQISDLETANLDIITQITDVESIKSQISKLESLYHKISHNKTSTEKELDFFQDNDNCPVCTQEIEKSFKESKVVDLQGKSLEYQVGLTKLKEQLEDAKKRQELVKSYQDKHRQNATEITHLNNVIHLSTKSISKLESEIARLSESPDIAKMQGKLEVYQEEFVEIEKRCSEVSRQKSEYEVVANLLKDSGIKARVIKKYIPVINKLINKYLTSMDFYVNFTLDEEFDEIIKSRYRDEFSYASFSEGEKQKIDLALLFTWREIARMKSSVSTNLLILDEVFDSSLDASGTEELLKILKNLDSSTNTFVISHKGEILVDKFHKNIRFDKISDFSKIVEEV